MRSRTWTSSKIERFLTFDKGKVSHFNSFSGIKTDGSTRDASGGAGASEARSNKADKPKMVHKKGK